MPSDVHDGVVGREKLRAFATARFEDDAVGTGLPEKVTGLEVIVLGVGDEVAREMEGLGQRRIPRRSPLPAQIPRKRVSAQLE
jgi:hypothetical protein